MAFSIYNTTQRDPKIEILELTSDYIKFLLTNTDLSMANGLRRIMIAEVPTLAIDLVHIKSNSSVLHDEFLAHRLGLIPIDSTQIDNFEYTKDCVCSGYCDRCSVEFNLKVKSNQKETLHVTTKDLRNTNPAVDIHPVVYYEKNQGGMMDDEDDLRAGNQMREQDPIVINKLRKNQEMDITCIAKKGIGKSHAKWSAVSTATFQQEPEVILNQGKVAGLTTQQKKEFVKSCPTNVYRYDEAKNSVEVENPLKCTLCMECVRKAESFGVDKLVKIGIKPERFYFTVESTGALKPEDIVLSALKEVKKKLKAVSDNLGGDAFISNR